MPAGVYPRVGGDGHDSFDISKLISRRWITAYLDASDLLSAQQPMAYIKINREKCKGCMLCISVCPKKQIKRDEALNKRGINPVIFLDSDCNGCTLCAVVCPDMAIEVYK